jgi:hypothetical protein
MPQMRLTGTRNLQMLVNEAWKYKKSGDKINLKKTMDIIEDKAKANLIEAINRKDNNLAIIDDLNIKNIKLELIWCVYYPWHLPELNIYKIERSGTCIDSITVTETKEEKKIRQLLILTKLKTSYQTKIKNLKIKIKETEERIKIREGQP